MYKFKLHQKVYLSHITHSPFKIHKRIKENGLYFYEVKSILSTRGNNNKIVHFLYNISKKIIGLERTYNLFLPFLYKSSVDSEVFKPGMINYPRYDNFIEEQDLSNFPYIKNSWEQPCSKNGCELINQFLDA